ncbi:MAG: HAD family hydrolase [Chloroflexi bacterium]|nr:HAD family hydrolase [Chloroflexota bacterium]
MSDSYKAVFFDLDGTLRIATPSPPAAFIHYARTLDIQINSVTERHVKLWAHEYWGQESLVQHDLSRFDHDEFWFNYSRLLLEKVHVTQNIGNRAKLVSEWFWNEYDPQIEVAAGSIITLANLKKKGYLLGLISNRSAPFDDEVALLGFEGLFDFTLAAGEISCWKPNPGIFTHAIKAFDNLQPQECIYVGDNYFADGMGAKAAGMVPVIFDPENLYTTSIFRRIQKMDDLLNWL